MSLLLDSNGNSLAAPTGPQVALHVTGSELDVLTVLLALSLDTLVQLKASANAEGEDVKVFAALEARGSSVLQKAKSAQLKL